MNRPLLENFTRDELRSVAEKIGCKRSGTKKDIITNILTSVNEKNNSSKSARVSQSLKSKQKPSPPPQPSSDEPRASRSSSSASHLSKPLFNVIGELGKGKEGTTLLVEDPKTSNRYAMKTFKKTKSIARLKTEVELQSLASAAGIAPTIYHVNEAQKYFVMDKLDMHIIDVIRQNNGLLPSKYQSEILNVFKKLDKAKVFHGDANIMNYMLHRNKLYMIDYGMSKHIDKTLVQKLGTSSPNYDIMSLGLVLKLRELGCPRESYSILIKAIPKSEQDRFSLNI